MMRPVSSLAAARLQRWLRSPLFRLAPAAVVMLLGAWLVAWWVVGVVLMVIGLGLGVDALLRDDGTGQRDLKSHADVIDWYRQAR